MELTTQTLEDAVAHLAALDLRAPGSLADGGLLEAQASAAKVAKIANAVFGALNQEVARRSAPELGAAGLARRQGFRSPKDQIASVAGTTTGIAAKSIAAGAALLPGGEGGEPGLPIVAVGLLAGDLSVDAAALIGATLDTIAPLSTDPELETEAREKRDDFERRLVERARVLQVKDLQSLCDRLIAEAAPEDWEERELANHDARAVSWSKSRSGMVTFTVKVSEALSAGLIAFFDGRTKEVLLRRRSHDPDEVDKRSIWQIRADALTDVINHGMGCEALPTLPTSIVVGRAWISDLEAGVGIAECDQLDAPISVGALRRMAANAQVISSVYGSQSELLDQGTATRLFTPAQIIALAARDGGCSFCHAPPSWCQAHHIKWWKRDNGPTDLSNGVLLCSACHHMVHRDGWEIQVIDNEVWFTPPESMLGPRTPRLGGNAALRLRDSLP